MKELSIEEKANAYDEAIDKIADVVEAGTIEQGLAEWLFPELKESEDEKIKKALIKLVKKAGEGYENVIDGVSIENAISWLEKQGEQKPADKVELKFKVGDVVRSSNDTMLKILGITDYCYNCVICATNDEYSFGFNIQDEFELVEQKPAELNDDDKQYLLVCKNALYKYQVSDQWDVNIIYQWLENKVKSSVQRPRQEWSDEDEDAIAEGIIALEDMYDPDEPERCYAGYTLTFDKAAERLKSLRPQNRWKPSDAQMEALTDAMDEYCGMYKATLCSLYNNLKKLKG